MTDTLQSYRINKTMGALARQNPYAVAALKEVWRQRRTHLITLNVKLGVFVLKQLHATTEDKYRIQRRPIKNYCAAAKKIFKKYDCLPLITGEVCIYRAGDLIPNAQGCYLNTWAERYKPKLLKAPHRPEIKEELLAQLCEGLGCTTHYAYWLAEWLQHAVRTTKHRMRVAPVLVWEEGDEFRDAMGQFILAILGDADSCKLQVLHTLPSALVRSVLEKRLVLLEDVRSSIATYQKLSTILSGPKSSYCDTQWMTENENLQPGALMIFSSNIHSLNRSENRQHFSGIQVSQEKRKPDFLKKFTGKLNDKGFIFDVYHFLLKGDMVGCRYANHVPCSLQYAELVRKDIIVEPQYPKALPKEVLSFVFKQNYVAFSTRDLARLDDCPIIGGLHQKIRVLNRTLKKYTDFGYLEYMLQTHTIRTKITIFHLLGRDCTNGRVYAEWRSERKNPDLYQTYKEVVHNYPERK